MAKKTFLLLFIFCLFKYLLYLCIRLVDFLYSHLQNVCKSHNGKNKMKLHVFNPEHDISLAQNNPNQTPSRAALQIRNDWILFLISGQLKGDVVLVNDVMKAY